MDSPVGWTQLPNDIIAAMPMLGNGELRVLLAIARKTIGYQKEADKISISQIEKLTGLTRRNAHAAIASLIERGFIDRAPAGKQTYIYYIKPLPLGVQLDDRIPSDTISLGGTEPLPVGIRSDQKPYPLGNTQKKDLKKKESPPPTSHPPRESSGGGGGFAETRDLLHSYRFSSAGIQEFCDLPPDVVRAELEIARKNGTGPGGLVNRWRDKRPTLTVPAPMPIVPPPPALAPGLPASKLREFREKHERSPV